ncbi:MAG: hypothetical protein ABSD08_13775 [Xanthobacteraceae bacterium]
MLSEMSAVERLFQVFTTCGRKATVEQNAAVNPRNVSLSIVFQPPQLAISSQTFAVILILIGLYKIGAERRQVQIDLIGSSGRAHRSRVPHGGARDGKH